MASGEPQRHPQPQRHFEWDPMLYVTRAQWGAEPPTLRRPLKTPVRYVIFSYSNSKSCEYKADCKIRMQQIQRCALHGCMEHDIKWNFLIGGDGRVYEGRGWFTAPPIINEDKPLAPLTDKAIEIGFICRDDIKPTEEMAEAAAALIKKGIEEKILAEDVKVTTIWEAYTIPKEVMEIENVRVSRHVQINQK